MSVNDFSDTESEFSGFDPVDDRDTPQGRNLSDFSDISDVSSVSSDDDASDYDVADNDELPDRRWTNRFTEPVIDDFTEQPGPNLPLGFDVATATPIDYFWLLFTQDLLYSIVQYTNMYAAWKQAQPGATPDQRWINTTVDEMRAFLGINIVMGVSQVPEGDMCWSTNPLLRNEGIARIMSCNRFQKMAQYLHVSNRAAEPARGSANYDRLYKIRPVINNVSHTFRRVFTLAREVSVDEAMIAFTGRLSYKQYMPAKPIKRGIKVWVLCDAKSAFMSRFEFYLGRENNQREHGLGHNVVMKLTEHLQNSHRWVYFFTGIPLMQQLLDVGLYACGMVRFNRKGFPPAMMKPATVRERGDFKVLQLEGTNLTASAWKDKKMVYHLSTLSSPNQVENATRRAGADLLQLRQPHAVHSYNKFMGGVDLNDQYRTKYEVGRKGKKVWKYIFWFLVNSCIVNAYIMYKSVSGRVTNLNFRLELAEYTKRKRKASQGLVIQRPVNNVEGHISVRLPGRKKVCKYHSRVLGQ